MSEIIDLTIGIVNYKTDEEMARCVVSIKKFTRGIKYEIVTVDNSINNRWYSVGNNLVLKKSKGRYVLFFNPDCYLKSNAFEGMIKWMDEHPKVGAIEPLQRYDDGLPAPTGSLLNSPVVDLIELTELSRLFGSVGRNARWGELKTVKRFRQTDKDRSKTWQTEVISGAAIMVRREVLNKVSGFDERLKLYYTDTDLSRRISKAGWEIWHVGGFGVFHSMRRSTRQLSWGERYSIYARDALKYYCKWGQPIQGFGLFGMMKLNQLMLKMIKGTET